MHQQRIKNLIKSLSINNFEALLVSSVNNIIYLTSYAGFSKDEREAYLLFTKKGNYIFTDGRYSEAITKYLPNFILIEISAKQSFAKALEEIINKQKIKALAIDLDDLNIVEFKRIRALVKTHEDRDIIEDLRTIKDDYEIKNIKTACQLTDKIFELILREIKPGVKEIEIARKIEILILSNNSRPSFNPIVAFGPNSSSPHHQSGNKKLNQNNIVLLDFGVIVDNYCSDMTRTVFMGAASSKFKNMYKTVLDAQTKAIESINQSINTSNIDNIAREYIKSENYPTIPHSLGHGIGLNVHEKPSLSPNSTGSLKKGMVFSVEPGIYLQGFGGVRIEDLVFFDGKKSHLFSHANKQIIEL